MSRVNGRTARIAILAAICVIAVIAVAMRGPIRQNPSYHDFADQREVFGVHNFWNVASNLPFALVGAGGLFLLRRRPQGILSELSAAYAIFFAGSILVALGSAYYHLEPNNT